MNRKAKKNYFCNFLTFFPKMKKGDANMWWIIIGAVIALVVLVVLMVIFTGKTNVLETGLLDCKSKGGECRAVPCPENTIESSSFSCPTGEGVCCLSSLKKINAACKANAECISGTCTGGKCS